MKTDDLVALLSKNVEPVDRNAVVRTLSVAIAGAALAAVGGEGFREEAKVGAVQDRMGADSGAARRFQRGQGAAFGGDGAGAGTEGGDGEDDEDGRADTDSAADWVHPRVR